MAQSRDQNRQDSDLPERYMVGLGPRPTNGNLGVVPCISASPLGNSDTHPSLRASGMDRFGQRRLGV